MRWCVLFHPLLELHCTCSILRIISLSVTVLQFLATDNICCGLPVVGSHFVYHISPRHSFITTLHIDANRAIVHCSRYIHFHSGFPNSFRGLLYHFQHNIHPWHWRRTQLHRSHLDQCRLRSLRRHSDDPHYNMVLPCPLTLSSASVTFAQFWRCVGYSARSASPREQSATWTRCTARIVRQNKSKHAAFWR
jgi:hypothetical protein